MGTILTGERTSTTTSVAVADASLGNLHQRYSIAGRGRYTSWGLYESRFDLAKEPHEPNRFGWVVEIDPLRSFGDPIKHSGARAIRATRAPP